jgi:hypothetical protein
MFKTTRRQPTCLLSSSPLGLCSGHVRYKSRLGNSCTEIFPGFPQSFQLNDWLVHPLGHYRFILNIVTCRGDYRRSFGLHIGSIYHLYIRLRITISYCATANLRNSQITTAPAKYFPACCVFTNRFLVTASNTGDSSASRSQVLSSQTPVQNRLSYPSCSPYNSSARTTQKHLLSKSTLIIAHRFIFAGTCLLSRCPETALVYPSLYMATGLLATVLSCVRVTYETGFGLDDSIYWSLLVQSLVINYNNSR